MTDNLTLQSARSDLLNNRIRQATLIGIPMYALNTIESWSNFHDPIAVGIQLGTAFWMLCLTALFYTPWGFRHKLAIFTFGFLSGVAGFEAIVCHERAFGSSYSDGFPVLYAFYCVLIPTTLLETAAVGIGVIVLTAVPEALVTLEFRRLYMAAVTDCTSFAILLAGRYIANDLWNREFVANRLHSDFVAAVSHEFRNALTSFNLLTGQLVSGKVYDEPRRRESYTTLFAEGQRMFRLIEGLLNFGRMEAGEIEHKFDNVDPVEIVPQVIREFERANCSRSHRVELRFKENTPLVLADHSALKCVVWNLLENAVKYSPGSPVVWVDVELENDHAAIRIRDSGFGIPVDEQELIFKKFVRGKSAKMANIAGTGVGLSLASWIIVAHGGTIRVVSEVGCGSTFSILLPAVKSK